VSCGLAGGDHLRLGAEEDLQHCQVAQLAEFVDRNPKPVPESFFTRCGDRIGLAPPPGALALLVEEPLFGQTRGLGVELRVLDRPELAEADSDAGFQVVGGAGGFFEQAEDDV
jgi:hypothetical protein